MLSPALNPFDPEQIDLRAIVDYTTSAEEHGNKMCQGVILINVLLRFVLFGRRIENISRYVVENLRKKHDHYPKLFIIFDL